MVQGRNADSPRRKRRSQLVRGAAIGILLGTSGLSSPLISPAIAQGYSFSQVTIEGNQNVEAASILKLAGITRGQQVTAADLNQVKDKLNDLITALYRAP